jgi:hypothetical protein
VIPGNEDLLAVSGLIHQLGESGLGLGDVDVVVG